MRRLIIPILTVALLITGYFAYTQYQLANDLTRRTESQYQRSFHELVWNIDTINSQLAKTLVSSSQEQRVLSLTNLLRETFLANSNVSGLPIAMVELDKTGKLINDVADYSYYVLKSNYINDKEMSDEEWSKLQDLYERCSVVREELNNLEAKVLDRDLSFVEVETVALRKGQELKDNTIVQGFTTIENKIKAFPELQFDEGIQKIEPEPRPLSGKEVSEAEALSIARKFMNDHDGPINKAEISFTVNGKIPLFGIKTLKENENIPTYLEVTKKGGQVLQMYQDRNIGQPHLDSQKAQLKAEQFLKEHDFKDMVLVEIDSNTSTANFTFVPSQEGVVIYLDMVKVNVALDNGLVVGFDQTSYLSYHHERNLSQPKMSEEEIIDRINPNLKIEHIRPAIIPSEYENKELLTYEVRGKIKDETFLIFINADTGEETRIVRMTKPKEYQVTVR